MKTYKIVALGALCLSALVSCELKDELKGEKGNTDETGALELDVSVLESGQSGARAEESVSTDDFPVTVINTETKDEWSYKTYAEMPRPLELPVGTYTVAAHTPGEIAQVMTAPYYGGDASLTVSQGIISQVDVVCKMQNIKISLNLTDEFTAAFSSWNITLDDGVSNTLTFTNTATGTQYWYLGADSEVTTLTLNITATTTGGVTIKDQRTFTKAEADEKDYPEDTDNFVGGDALNITMSATDDPDPGEPDKSTIGFDIQVDLTFSGTDDTIEIPVTPVVTPDPEPDPDPTPGTGDDTDGPTMEIPADITYSLSDESSQPASADVLIKASAGLKSVKVWIKPGNAGFESVMSDMSTEGIEDESGNKYKLDFLDTGVELIAGTQDSKGMTALFNSLEMTVDMPAESDTEYTFPVGAFFTFLNITGATDAGTPHSFKISVTDMNGELAEGTLNVTIK